MAEPELNAEQLRRYARQVVLPEVGVEGQKRLQATRVLCIGAGGLGSPIALYLTAAGIGRLGLVEFDQVDVSNLHRQILYRTDQVGQSKCHCAQETLRALNPEVEVAVHPVRLSRHNALEIISAYDIVADGSDNFPTRYLANDACVLLKKPYVYGAVFRFEGQVSVFAPHLGAPCYRCLFPEPPPPGTVPSCAEAGVLGVLPGLIGCLQAIEVLKLALGLERPLLGRLLVCDALAMSFRTLQVRPDPQCPICGPHPTITDLIDYEQFCGSSCRAATEALGSDEVTVHDLKAALENPGLGICVIDVREPHEHAIARIPGVPLYPLSTLAQRCSELDPNRTIYVHCKSGVRSLQAVQLLRARGFKSVKSVKGGILAWAAQIDPSVPIY
jgi:adenylyltransferase/sulfurtransferase